MSDIFKHHSIGLQSPPFGGMAITPNDSTDLANSTRAINVGQSGVVRVTTLNGDDIALYVAAGVVFPIRATRVWATNTTAGDIIGLF